MGDVKAVTTDWNIYIPIAKVGKTVDFLNITKGARDVSESSQFDMKLSGPITENLPEGTVVTYAAAANPSMNGLAGAADTTKYYTLAEINAMTAEQQKAFWDSVTCVHIYTPNMDVGKVSNFALSYQKAEKTEIGTQHAYSALYYNYSVNGELKYSQSGTYKYGVSTLAQYDLVDMYISGKAWTDKSHNSLLDSKDTVYPGLAMKVSLVDDGGNVVRTYDQTAEIESASGGKLNAAANADGEYTLAVPGYGKYVVEFAVPDATAAVTKLADGGTANNQSVFNPDGKTDTVTLDASVAEHHLYNQNAGLYSIILNAQNFSYGVDETAAITEEQAKKLAFASTVGVDGDPVDLSRISVDAAQLKALNDAIASGKLSAANLSFSYVYDDGGTPDDTSDDRSVTQTVKVTLKDHGDGIAQTDDRITADDASYGIDCGALTASDLRKLVHADSTSKDGKSYAAGLITVGENDLKALNDAIASGKAKPGDKYSILLTSPDGSTVTSVITLRENGKIASSSDYITADGFSLSTASQALTADAALKSALAGGRDENGFPYDADKLTPDAAQLKAINDAMASATNGTKMPLTFTTPAGTAVTVNVTLTRAETPGGGSAAPEFFTSDHIAYLYGFPDDTIRPGADMTRAQAAVVIYRLLSDETRAANKTTVCAYPDVTDGSWYETAVATLSGMGIIRGFPDGTFKPDASITRAQFAAMFARFDSSSYSGADKFSDISGHWAANLIDRAAVKGWVEGFPDGTFRPDENITRAQAATLINRVLVRLPESVSDLVTKDMKSFADNSNADAWYYLALQEAINTHTYTLKNDKTHETWKAVLSVNELPETTR
jgi:hypothetical protein